MACSCGKKSHPELEGAPYDTSMPRPCWLYANSERYRRAWDKEPPLTEKVVKLAGAVKEFIKEGLPLVDEETYQKRRAQCDACEYRDTERDVCKLCWCYLGGVLLNKLKMATEKCPDGRW